ncbi:MAG: hypothetical protein IJ411_02115, partial [Oscillospiraceae bacterium]|nr:hypothetical protein [Oscillospiraceae bacterium]
MGTIVNPSPQPVVNSFNISFLNGLSYETLMMIGATVLFVLVIIAAILVIVLFKKSRRSGKKTEQPAKEKKTKESKKKEKPVKEKKVKEKKAKKEKKKAKNPETSVTEPALEPAPAPQSQPEEAEQVIEQEPPVPAASPASEPVPTTDAANDMPVPPELKEIQNMSAAVDIMASNRRRTQDPNKKKKKTANTKKKKSNAKKEARALKKKANKLKITKTAQDTIPYYAVYEHDGIIETEPGVFTKSYLLGDVNYKIARREEQEEMFAHYGELLNSFGPESRFEITFNQKNINMDEFERQTMLPMKDDG